MKIKDDATYPHPVLRKYSDDYQTGNFDVEYHIDTKGSSILCTVLLDEPHIANLVNDKLAKIGVFITCEDTSCKHFFELENVATQQGLDFSPRNFKGAVSLRAIVFSTKTICDYEPSNLHQELADIKWMIEKGELLAFSPEKRFHASNAKLRPTETIFMFTERDDIEEGIVRINLEEEKIAIEVNRKSLDRINEMRATITGKQLMLNSVYLPAVMEVLSQLSQDTGQYENKAWYSVFHDKCTYLGIDITASSPLEDAQKILQQPLSLLFNNKELIK
ncbi:hypothetical protein [Photobacterium phosphoreum]|uniref:hypothetical protein n=1 Tax=Photobacterium phosphoreum TaxID=659 RepID=UPI001E38D822|nr:hypothetical protein [Photobacterium phosphoreum]MCD9505482.1 hypothetical protein [Photobacterium phosphoreum]